MTSGRRVSLVLGSGGARGYAHIGAVQVLRERGYEIVAVAGSSMGALVGGIFAAGKLDEFAEWALGLSRRDVMQMVDVRLTGPGVMRAERVLQRVRELVGDQRIEDLPLPFTAVATDLLARREVWLQNGPLDIAIRASIAMPGLFTPVMLNGRLLADGGMMAPVPVAPTASVPTDLTVAISLGGEREGAAQSVVRESADPGPLDHWVARFREGAAQAFGALAGDEAAAPTAAEPADVPAPEADPMELPSGVTRFDVINYSLETMQEVVNRYRLAGFPPDVLITIPKDACATLDFHRAASMVEFGRERATQALDELEAAGPASLRR